MEIVLINPRLKTWSPNVYVPLGLAYVAAVLEQAGHRVKIVDFNAQRVSAAELDRRLACADTVGITGMITEYDEVVRLVGMVKQVNPAARVVLGGPLATTFPHELLRASPADFIVTGEGEKTIVHLVAAMEQGGNFDSIGGIVFKAGSEIVTTGPAGPITDLDTIPLPARHLLDMKRYLKDHFASFGIKVKGLNKVRSTNLISSRGCPYSCTFCFKGMWGHKWRGRTPENIIGEMEQLYRSYGVNGFFFTDDTFVLNRERVFELCRRLKEKGLPVVWYCNGRINLMTRELLQAMSDAGCRGIAYGLESGNQQVLDSIKKDITLDQVRRAINWTKEAGINTTGYFMIGLPGETRAIINETLAFARELALDFYGFSLLTPLPGTELYDSALKAGLIPRYRSLREWSLHVNANLTRDCSDGELAAFGQQAFKEFFLQKRFGKNYFLNPGFLKEDARILFSLRNREQARELLARAKGIIGRGKSPK